jgi:hypothetical protein
MVVTTRVKVTAAPEWHHGGALRWVMTGEKAGNLHPRWTEAALQPNRHPGSTFIDHRCPTEEGRLWGRGWGLSQASEPGDDARISDSLEITDLTTSHLLAVGSFCTEPLDDACRREPSEPPKRGQPKSLTD